MPQPAERAIDTVCLDAAGTLITVARPVAETYAALAARHGGTLDAGAVPESFRRRFRAMPPMAFPDAPARELAARERAWWRELVAAVVGDCGTVADFAGYFDALFELYARGSAWRVFDEVPEVLARLSGAGYRLVLVSNFDSRIENILRALELDRHLDAVVYSTLAGAAEPERRIFETALAAVGAHPAHAVHVGDSRRADYAGARDAGLAALLLDRTGAHAQGTAERIDSLRGLCDWLQA